MGLLQKIALNDLEIRERDILHLYFFCGYKEHEIASYYNISRPRVSQIKRMALDRLRVAMA